MNLSYKLQKLVTGDAFASALRHAREGYPRRPLGVDAARLTRAVPSDKFQEIRRRHGVANPGDAWPKYLDLERWIGINLRRVRALGLDLGRRKRILDLGCGTGYFLYICQYFGHDVLGLDIDATPGFAEMLALLGVARVIWQIRPFVPLPDLGRQFDVITAQMICFNGHKSEQLWGIREWEFFLDDLAKHLRPRGVVALDLNREYDGTNYTPELKAYFESRGAVIHTQQVRFNSLAVSPRAGLCGLAGLRKTFSLSPRSHPA
jgi:SAM-dependent methyltransferase